MAQNWKSKRKTCRLCVGQNLSSVVCTFFGVLLDPNVWTQQKYISYLLVLFLIWRRGFLQKEQNTACTAQRMQWKFISKLFWLFPGRWPIRVAAKLQQKRRACLETIWPSITASKMRDKCLVISKQPHRVPFRLPGIIIGSCVRLAGYEIFASVIMEKSCIS